MAGSIALSAYVRRLELAAAAARRGRGFRPPSRTKAPARLRARAAAAASDGNVVAVSDGNTPLWLKIYALGTSASFMVWIGEFLVGGDDKSGSAAVKSRQDKATPEV